jgi:hypothetical protein
VSPDELSSCTATAGATPCFNVAGTKLDLSSFFDTSGSFTKLSD